MYIQTNLGLIILKNTLHFTTAVPASEMPLGVQFLFVFPTFGNEVSFEK